MDPDSTEKLYGGSGFFWLLVFRFSEWKGIYGGQQEAE